MSHRINFNFSTDVIDTDEYCKMSLTAQAVYICMMALAEEDGFLIGSEYFKVKATEDFAELVENGYVVEVPDGVMMITSYRLAEYLRNKGLVRRNLPEEEKPEKPAEVKKYDWIVEAWNRLERLGVTPIRAIKDRSLRIANVRARVREYGKEAILEAINNVSESDFLVGGNGNGWTITFDWFIKKNNFQKVYEGNYNKRKPAPVREEKAVKEEEHIDLWGDD